MNYSHTFKPDKIYYVVCLLVILLNVEKIEVLKWYIKKKTYNKLKFDKNTLGLRGILLDRLMWYYGKILCRFLSLKKLNTSKINILYNPFFFSATFCCKSLSKWYNDVIYLLRHIFTYYIVVIISKLFETCERVSAFYFEILNILFIIICKNICFLNISANWR